MELVITPNERHLLQLFVNDEHLDTQWTTENLDIGDCLIRRVDTQEVVSVIERKTVGDLWSSFADHRYENQKERMLSLRSNNDALELVFIIEGVLEDLSEERRKCLWAALHSMQSHYNIVVHRTLDLAGTHSALKNLLRYHESAGGRRRKSSGSGVPLKVSHMKLKPSDSLTPDKWMMHALMLIPRMPIKGAEKLAIEYGSLSNIEKELHSQDGYKRIVSLMIDEKRKLGKAIADKLKQHLLTN